MQIFLTLNRAWGCTVGCSLAKQSPYNPPPPIYCVVRCMHCASAPYPKEKLLATIPPHPAGSPFPHSERCSISHFVSFRVSCHTTWGVRSYVSVGSVPSMATLTLFVVRGVIYSDSTTSLQHEVFFGVSDNKVTIKRRWTSIG